LTFQLGSGGTIDPSASFSYVSGGAVSYVWSDDYGLYVNTGTPSPESIVFAEDVNASQLTGGDHDAAFAGYVVNFRTDIDGGNGIGAGNTVSWQDAGAAAVDAGFGGPAGWSDDFELFGTMPDSGTGFGGGGVSGSSADFAFPDPASFRTAVFNSVGPYWIAAVAAGVAIAGCCLLVAAIVRRRRVDGSEFERDWEADTGDFDMAGWSDAKHRRFAKWLDRDEV
jgi:hypothetical protein